MKLYKKSKLNLINGRLVNKKGKVIMPDLYVVQLANDLERDIQKVRWIKQQPKACEGPDLNEFKFESIAKTYESIVDTPLLDKKVAETMALMKELDTVSITNATNKMMERYQPLLEFVSSNEFFGREWDAACFDTKTLGNVLDWTEDDVIAWIIEAGTGADTEWAEQ